jgi:hypothetical protein
VAIESLDSVEGRKASHQARSSMIMHTEDAYVKLFAGADTAEKAWRKLHENFEKTSNARMVQLRKKLTSLTLMPGKSIAEYVGDFREIKMDLETAGQTVSELELAVHALNGLPKEYATLVEYLELSETELTLDMIQPKLMQREQNLKSLGVEVEVPEEEEESSGKAFVAKRERYGVTVTKGSSERGNSGGVKGEASDMRTCYAGKRATSGPIAKSKARSATIVVRGGTLVRCVKSPEVVQEVVVKTRRSFPVWGLRRGPKRRGRQRVWRSLTREALNTLWRRRANLQATRGLHVRRG